MDSRDLNQRTLSLVECQKKQLISPFKTWFDFDKSFVFNIQFEMLDGMLTYILG